MSKEAMKLALEALNVAEHFVEEYAASKYYFAHIAAKTSLEEALAKQEHEEMVSKARYNRLRDDYSEAIELLRLAALAAKKWEEHVNRCQLQGVDLDHNFAPQQRKPLTDEQIADIVIEMNGNEPPALFWKDLTRAIEAAHGIKEKNT